MKVETITYEYKHCGECSGARSDPQDATYCLGVIPQRLIPCDDLWGDIPDWCPLEEKKDAKV